MDWGENSMPGGGIQLARKKQILFYLFLSLMKKSMARITNTLEEILSQNPRPISLDIKTKFRIIRSRLNAIISEVNFYFSCQNQISFYFTHKFEALPWIPTSN
jgi:hypothetical protein